MNNIEYNEYELLVFAEMWNEYNKEHVTLEYDYKFPIIKRDFLEYKRSEFDTDGVSLYSSIEDYLMYSNDPTKGKISKQDLMAMVQSFPEDMLISLVVSDKNDTWDASMISVKKCSSTSSGAVCSELIVTLNNGLVVTIDKEQ